MQHHRLARSRRERRLERAGVSHARREQRIGVELGRVDGVGMHAGEIEMLGHHVRPEGAVIDLL